MYHPYPLGHYSLVYVHWSLKAPALVPDKFSSSLKSWKGTFTYKIKSKIRKDYTLTRGFAAIHTTNSCHLLSIYSCPKHFTCIIFTLSSQVRKVRAFIIFILLVRRTCGDLESLLHLPSEGDASWPHFKSGRPSLGSPLVLLLSGWGLLFQACPGPPTNPWPFEWHHFPIWSQRLFWVLCCHVLSPESYSFLPFLLEPVHPTSCFQES